MSAAGHPARVVAHALATLGPRKLQKATGFRRSELERVAQGSADPGLAARMASEVDEILTARNGAHGRA